MSKIDARTIEEIKARSSLHDLIGQRVNLTRVQKGEYKGLCPFHGEKTPSFTVSERKGFYKCFGCGAHGDAIKFIQEMFGQSFIEAVKTLASDVGVDLGQGTNKINWDHAKPPVQRLDNVADERERQGKINWARKVWQDTSQDDGTVARYLIGRGIDLAATNGVPPDIRFTGFLKHKESGLHLPAMVAGVRDVKGDIIGVHRTYLTIKRDGTVVKAAVSSPKKMGGVVMGGAIRLSPAAENMCTAEGVETGMSIIAATGKPVWVAMSLANMGEMVFPSNVKRNILCADNDSKDPQQFRKTMAKAVHEQIKRGVKCSIAWPDHGHDFNDMMQGG